jgi:hypothetical protein
VTEEMNFNPALSEERAGLIFTGAKNKMGWNQSFHFRKFSLLK